MAEGQLLHDGKEVPLTPKAFQVLHTLVENCGHVIDKEVLMKRVWADSFVEEKNLADNISILRKALGDDPKEPRYIKTVPRRGYRFVAEVREAIEGGADVIVRLRESARFIVEEDNAFPEPAGGAAQAIAPQSLPASTGRRIRPILVVAAVTLGVGLAFAAYSRWKHNETLKAPLARSIAVLPFKPLVAASADPALELGITDALISKLSNIRQIVVRPTNSVLKYSGDSQDLRVAGSDLAVDVLLDGRVQNVGDRIRLSVQLVRTADGVPIWAETFDENFKDVFAVQDAISAKVASALALQLTGEEKHRLAKRYTDNPEAYQFYVKGLYQWRTFSKEGLTTSLNFYNAAIEKDPNYALAYAGLANSYNVMAIYGPVPTSEAMEKSRVAARKAVELDNTLPDAHVAIGAVKLLHEWDWAGAESDLKRAIELAPESVEGHQLYGYYLQATGRVDSSVDYMKRAADSAPQWHVATHDYFESLFMARRYDEAIERSIERLKLETNEPFILWILGRSYMMKGKYDDAVKQFELGLNSVEDQAPDSAQRVWLYSGLGYAHALAGRGDEARIIVRRMRESQSRWKDVYIAAVLAGLNDKDQAFASLEDGYRRRFPFLWHLKCAPEFDSLRSDQRYADLLQRMNLAQ